MNKPNLYDFATSELSQDATLAYMLAWAAPGHHQQHPQHPELNRLEEDLLRCLVAAAADGRGRQDDPLHGRNIETLKVGTQRDHMDVWAEINNTVFLIVEDKTETSEHSNQMARGMWVIVSRRRSTER